MIGSPNVLLVNQKTAARAVGLTQAVFINLEKLDPTNFPVLKLGERRRRYSIDAVIAYLNAKYGAASRVPSPPPRRPRGRPRKNAAPVQA